MTQVVLAECIRKEHNTGKREATRVISKPLLVINFHVHLPVHVKQLGCWPCAIRPRLLVSVAATLTAHSMEAACYLLVRNLATTRLSRTSHGPMLIMHLLCHLCPNSASFLHFANIVQRPQTHLKSQA